MINLPEPISAYFSADRRDADGVADCFTRDAIVKDEGRTYSGTAEIKRWKTESTAKWTYTCEPLGSEQVDGKTVVTCHLEGSFPGGQVDLRFFFRLERGKIASLEIIP